jgi:hypothetical protein
MNLRKCVLCEELASGRVSCVVGAIHANPVGTTHALEERTVFQAPGPAKSANPSLVARLSGLATPVAGWHGVTGGAPARVALYDFFRSLRHA